MTAAIANAVSRKNLFAPVSIILLLLLMSWSSSVGPFTSLHEDLSPSFVIVENAATADTAINLSAPNNQYSSSPTIHLATVEGTFFFEGADSRGLFDFNISDSCNI